MPSPDDPVVTWTTPHMRAERALQRAGEALEFGKMDEVKRQLDEHDLQIARLKLFIASRVK